MSNKVNFPRDPRISNNCKSLVNKILAPLKSRIRITGIRVDTWFTHDLAGKCTPTLHYFGLFQHKILKFLKGRLLFYVQIPWVTAVDLFQTAYFWKYYTHLKKLYKFVLLMFKIFLLVMVIQKDPN